MTINCALFGYGRAGKIHYSNLVNCDNVNLLFVCDTNLDNISVDTNSSVHFTKDYTLALESNDVEAIFICTPTFTHYNLVKSCLGGNKHVFCEKPLSESEEEIAECYSMAEERNLVLLTAYNRRFDPTIRSLKERIPSIGKIFQISTISRDFPYPSPEFLKTSGGIFRDCAVHDIDYVCWLLGVFPKSVYVTGIVVEDNSVGCGELDSAVIIAKFDGDIIANITLARISSSYDQRAFIFGSEGQISMENPHTDKPISFPTRYEDSYENELYHFLKVIKKEEDLIVTKDDCINLFRTIKACEKSFLSGQVEEVEIC